MPDAIVVGEVRCRFAPFVPRGGLAFTADRWVDQVARHGLAGCRDVGRIGVQRIGVQQAPASFCARAMVVFFGSLAESSFA
jgi:hypothetical protein